MIWQVPSQIYGNTGVCRSDDEACELPEHTHTKTADDALLQRPVYSCQTQPQRQPNNFLPFILLPQRLRYG